MMGARGHRLERGPAGGKRRRAPSSNDRGAALLQQIVQRNPQHIRSLAKLVELYLERIEAVDRGASGTHALAEPNPDAFREAERLDRERKAGHLRGPLHGLPIVVKDNLDTADGMRTTAGSLALLDSKPERDAFAVERLRAAGALLLGKTSLSEWTNFRSTRSTSGWSGRGGQVRNPYALDRNPCGSSSGSGVAPTANLCAAAAGTVTAAGVVELEPHPSMRPVAVATARAQANRIRSEFIPLL